MRNIFLEYYWNW